MRRSAGKLTCHGGTRRLGDWNEEVDAQWWGMRELVPRRGGAVVATEPGVYYTLAEVL